RNVAGAIVHGEIARRKRTERRFVVVERETNLLQAVLAFAASRSFAGGLHGGKQQRDENANDGNNNEQLNERKTAAAFLHFVFPLRCVPGTSIYQPRWRAKVPLGRGYG